MADDSFDRMKENAQERSGKAKASAQERAEKMKMEEASARAKAKQSFEAHEPKKTES
jgi:hypothetical protein